jgi:hypothetical protein
MPKKSAAAGLKAAGSAPRKSRAAKAAPTHEEIALRAYHLYLARNGAPGNPFEDWTRAEQELVEEFSKPKGRRKSKVIEFAA